MAGELTSEIVTTPSVSLVARSRSTLRHYLPAIVLLPGGLIVWELVVRVFNIQGFLLPAPSLILQTFVDNSAALVDRGWYTFQEALGGFVIGCGLGMLFGLLTARFRTLSTTFMPFAIAINAVPIIALSPLVRIWFGIDQASKIVVVAILCFFPVLISTVRGLTAASPAALDLMRSYATPELEIFWKVRLPTALPFIFTGLKVCTSLSMIGAIVAEFYGGLMNRSLGTYIANEASQVRFRNSWSGILIASLFGIVFYLVVGLIERLAIPWHVSIRGRSE